MYDDHIVEPVEALTHVVRMVPVRSIRHGSEDVREVLTRKDRTLRQVRYSVNIVRHSLVESMPVDGGCFAV